MSSFSRDLWLHPKQDHRNPQELDRELAFLHALLYHAESWEAFCQAHEIIDTHKRKIFRKPHLMQKALHNNRDTAFLFVNNLN
ncbi:MAG: hypothetical protein GXC72_01610 [Chitinophagaceae bacterium]|jgi:hypothetical protein|nr:hypothetical protein [Chitinophagaceae bacterium]